jgi:hypothetical protein
MLNMVYEEAQASLLSSYSAQTPPTHLAFTAGRSTILTFCRSLSSLCVACLCKLTLKRDGGRSQIRRQQKTVNTLLRSLYVQYVPQNWAKNIGLGCPVWKPPFIIIHKFLPTFQQHSLLTPSHLPSIEGYFQVIGGRGGEVAWTN